MARVRRGKTVRKSRRKVTQKYRFIPATAFQRGYGMRIYRGRALQRGYGIGGLFKNAFRMAVPLLKKVGKTMGKRVLKAGAGALSDITDGANVKESLKKHAKEIIRLSPPTTKSINTTKPSRKNTKSKRARKGQHVKKILAPKL